MNDSDSGESKIKERSREYDSNEDFMEEESSSENNNTEIKTSLKREYIQLKKK